MPVVFEASADGSNAKWYKHHSLVRFYLDQANTFSIQAIEEDFEGAMMASSVIGILFSAMSLEAFCNEIAEDVFAGQDLADFQFCKGRFRRGKSSAVSKINYLFLEASGKELSQQLREQATSVFSIRNNLSHYKPNEMATVFEGPTIGNRIENPNIPLVLDLKAEIKKINPALVEKVTGLVAAESFNTSLEIIQEWGKRKGIDNNVPGLTKIT